MINFINVRNERIRSEPKQFISKIGNKVLGGHHFILALCNKKHKKLTVSCTAIGIPKPALITSACCYRRFYVLDNNLDWIDAAVDSNPNRATNQSKWGLVAAADPQVLEK